jgi:hypothetical protein
VRRSLTKSRYSAVLLRWRKKSAMSLKREKAGSDDLHVVLPSHVLSVDREGEVLGHDLLTERELVGWGEEEGSR